LQKLVILLLASASFWFADPDESSEGRLGLVDRNGQKEGAFARIHEIASRIHKERSSESFSMPIAPLTNTTRSIANRL